MKSLNLKVKQPQQDHSGFFNFKEKTPSTSFSINSNSQIPVSGEIEISKESEVPHPKLNFVKSQRGFSVECPDGLHMWEVVKEIKQPNGIKGHLLKKGDLIRIGGVRLKVNDIGFGETTCLTTNTSEFEPESSSDLPCRICLSSGESQSNPLVSPCKCTGSMQNIHFNCLQKWLLSKLAVRHRGFVSTYHWPNLKCELCGTDLPPSIDLGDKRLDFIQLRKPATPFLVLEDTRHDSLGGTLVHYVAGNKFTDIKIGKDPYSDIKISDSSVSDLHASIIFKKGSFYLLDKDSTYGTLVGTKNLVLETGRTKVIQVGNKLLKIKPKDSLSFFGKCFHKARASE